MDPIGNVAVFVSIVKRNRKRIAFEYLSVSFFIIISFLIVASILFKIYSIAISIFEIFSGSLLIFLGMKMVLSKNKEIKNSFPFIISLYSGPGVITTSMVLLSKSIDIEEEIFVYGVVLLAIFFSWLSIALYEKFEEKLKKVVGYVGLWKGFSFIIFGFYFLIDGIRLLKINF